MVKEMDRIHKQHDYWPSIHFREFTNPNNSEHLYRLNEFSTIRIIICAWPQMRYIVQQLKKIYYLIICSLSRMPGLTARLFSNLHDFK